MIDRGIEGIGQWNHDHEALTPHFVVRNRYYRHFVPANRCRNHSNVPFLIGPDVNTVRTHVYSLLRKFGVHRVTDIVRVLKQGETSWAGAAARSR